jgi:hypothetical protein
MTDTVSFQNIVVLDAISGLAILVFIVMLELWWWSDDMRYCVLVTPSDVLDTV